MWKSHCFGNEAKGHNFRFTLILMYFSNVGQNIAWFEFEYNKIHIKFNIIAYPFRPYYVNAPH